MVEFILKFVIVLSALAVVQAFYNAYLYRQPKNVERISAVSSATIAVVLVSGALWFGVNYLNKAAFKNKDYPNKQNWNYKPNSY